MDAKAGHSEGVPSSIAPVLAATLVAPTINESRPSAPRLPEGVALDLDDFVLLRELGRGAFARVYLAQQVSLDRRVALKVTNEPVRVEGQTLAGLEHDNIVKVYSEFHDRSGARHGLVLQYVPGTTLGQVLSELYRDGNRPHRGQAILDAVDKLASEDVGFDPAALRDREFFADGDYVATMCRLCARLAEALAFAHAKGILHCDIKPANILLNRYGRPLLVDFNIAVPIRGKEKSTSLGGTIAYMSYEHLAAFYGVLGADPQKVDGRADLYSLALVLVEALAGHLPTIAAGPDDADLWAAYLRVKNEPPEKWLTAERALYPDPVWRVLRRCLDPNPDERYPTGVEMARALRQAADLHEGRQNLPPAGKRLPGFNAGP